MEVRVPSLDSGVADRVSIIIPTYKQLGFARACIESVLAYTTYPDFEIIVTDDASGVPPLLAYLRAMADAGKIRLFLHKERGQVKNVMKVFPESTGQFICWMNDDIEIPEGQGNWLNILVQALKDNRPAVASVTPIMYHGRDRKTIYWAGKKMENWKNKYHDHLHEPFGSPRIPTKPVECCYNTFGCCLTWRKLVEVVPLGFKATHYGVDSEWCFRIRRALGLTHYMIPDTYVYHANIYNRRI